jgi:hypothetical protein
MKRFYFDEDDEDEDEDEMIEEAKYMFPEMIPEFITMGGAENPDQQALIASIRICENSFGWWFAGVDRRMEMVGRVFKSIKLLMEQPEQPEQPGPENK